MSARKASTLDPSRATQARGTSTQASNTRSSTPSAKRSAGLVGSTREAGSIQSPPSALAPSAAASNAEDAPSAGSAASNRCRVRSSAAVPEERTPETARSRRRPLPRPSASAKGR